MGKIDQLIRVYEDFAALPWQERIAGAQRVWFAVYDPADERRVRQRLEEFGNATRRARHSWQLCDLTDVFAEWMVGQEYRDAYFESPDDLEIVLADLRDVVAQTVTQALDSEGVDESTVVGVCGAASLFGLLRVSELLDDVSSRIRGRLLVFFPGKHEGNTFRLLDARDGWNYHAVAIKV